MGEAKGKEGDKFPNPAGAEVQREGDLTHFFWLTQDRQGMESTGIGAHQHFSLKAKALCHTGRAQDPPPSSAICSLFGNSGLQKHSAIRHPFWLCMSPGQLFQA